METFNLNILGCGSATPSARHMTASQVVDFRGKLMMIDCGEGAQMTMRRMGLNFSRLNHIFISHLHGDHCLGLPGLLSTFGLHEKGGSVTVHTTEEGRSVLEPMVRFFCAHSPYEILFDTYTAGEKAVLYEDKALVVETFPLYHRIDCNGFIFREKPKGRHLRGDMLKHFDIPVSLRAAIKEGADYVTPDGRVVPNAALTTDPSPSASYAYCSDTLYDERVAQWVEGVDVIYHEATFDSSLADLALRRGHSTAAQAARIAAMAGAKTLIIGHYSKRYRDARVLRDEAAAIFPNVIASDEGMVIPINDPAGLKRLF